MNRTSVAIVAVTWMGLVGAASGAETPKALDLARRTLALVEREAPRPKLAAELKALAARAGMGKAIHELRGTSENELYAEVLRLRRRIILSHPALDFDKLLINQRTGRLPGHMCDQYLGRHHGAGPGLVVIDSWKDKPTPRPLLAGKLPPGLVLHPDLSFDAKRVVFSFCDTSRPTDRRHRGHFLYEIDLASGKIRQVTGTVRDPFEGSGGRQTVLIEDFDPCYLPDGGFAFISTRSQQYGRCHGNRYVPSYVLYRCDADGSNIRRLSFNEANDWDPAVLHDGTIIYCRWDYINRHDTNFQSLWVMRPDGRGTAHFYGNNSVGPCMITEARAIPGSHKVVATATDHHGNTSGSILVIDTYKGQDGGEPLLGITPDIGFPERRAPQGTSYTPRPLREAAAPKSDRPRRRKRSGRAATPLAVNEDLFFVSIDHGGHYAVYLVDTLGGRELIYEDPKNSCFSPIPIKPVRKPPVVCSLPAGTEDLKTGLFYVEDVYQSTEHIERGTVKALRVSQIISQPTRAKPKLSYVNNEILKRILGTVPVGADGSVAFEAPAQTPLQFQLLDADGLAVMTMRSLVYVQPGELAGCVGCHEPRKDTPALKRPAYAKFHKLKAPAGPRYEGGFSYARTVQPVLDRYCIRCHGLGKTAGKINLLGTHAGSFCVSYDSLMKRGRYVKIAQRNGETVPSRLKDYFAHAGRLVGVLREKHKDRLRLDAGSFQRIVDWLDLNAQYYGDYSFNRAERCRADGRGEKALREHVRLVLGESWASQPFAALVNVALPTESRVLNAPLAVQAGGWGQTKAPSWSNKADAGYRRMLELVKAAIRPMERHDVAGTCGSEDGKRGCRCGNCWVRQIRAKRKQQAALARGGRGETP